MELNNFGVGGRGAGGGKGEKAGGDSSNRKTVVKFVVRWTVFQKESVAMHVPSELLSPMHATSLSVTEQIALQAVGRGNTPPRKSSS